MLYTTYLDETAKVYLREIEFQEADSLSEKQLSGSMVEFDQRVILIWGVGVFVEQTHAL